MAKRGPKSKGEYGEQRKVMSTRVTHGVHAALTKAAKVKNLTFSSEVERRLRRSFEDDRRIADLLGGREVYALLRTVAASMNLAGEIALMYRPDKVLAREVWLNDPYAYDQAVKAITTVLEAFRPEGDASPPEPMMTVSLGEIPEDVAEELSGKNLGRRAASGVLHDIADAEPSISLPDERALNDDEKLARSIAADLGPLQKRLKGKTK